MAPPVAPLDTLESAVDLARVRLNDAIASIGGDVVTDVQPFTLAFINGAWRRLQEYAVSLGFSWLEADILLANVPAVTSPDPAVQVYLDWSGCFDGTVKQATPMLPQNLIAPTDLWERFTGVPMKFYTMDPCKQELPAVPHGSLNKRWHWMSGALYLPGATVATDIKIRYAAAFPDFVDPNVIPFANQKIPILRMANPLAWYICAEVAHSRGGLDTAYFDDHAKQAMDLALTTNGETVP